MHHSDEDLDHLAELLNRIPVECDGMELSELDGFVAGLLVCPEMIMPSEWLSLVWGGEGRGKFANVTEVQEITTAIMDHYNRVAQTLATDPDLYDPIYGAEMNSNDLLWEPWIDGFESAMALRPDSWIKIVESGDEEASSSISMIIAMHGIYIGETELDDEAIDEIDKIGPELIPNFVKCLNHWTKSRHAQFRNVLRDTGAAAPEAEPIQVRSKKIGRNDPCYCGSGRKYKRCCGAH